MNKDLTVGKPERVLWSFCLPLFASVIFQQLYNIADSFVAGKFIGKEALAAVGNSYEVTLILLAFGFGCNIGCSVIVSRLFGAKKIARMKSAVYTALISTAVLCAFLMIIGFLFCNPLLTIMKTPAEIFEDSAAYLEIYLLGLPFVFFYNVSTSIFSALGDSITPFIFLVCSSIANIGADILFVAAFNMGVPGVAWATLICQGISCILAVIVVFNRLSKLQAEEKVKAFDMPLFKEMAKIAIPSTLQQSFVSIGNIVIQRVINGFGSDAIAGYTAAVKLNNMVITSLVTIGNGISNFTSQNLGAGKKDRIKEGFKAGWKMVWIIAVPIIAIFLLLSKNLINLFMDANNVEAVKIGALFIYITAPFYFVISLKFIADGVLRGAGRMPEFMADTFTDLIIRVVLAIVLSKTALGITGVWVSWPVGWGIATIMAIVFYIKYIKTK